MSFKGTLLKIFSPLACEVGWPMGSNLRGKHKTADIDIQPADRVSSVADIKNLVRKLYYNYEGTADKFDQLGDCICPPPYNYKRGLDGILQDDCDGFHSLIMHCLKKSDIECYLLSVVAVGGSHCVLLFKHNITEKGHVVDYYNVLDGNSTPEEAIANYNSYFKDRYKPKSDVLYNGLLDYSYTKKKFVKQRIKNLK